MQPMSFGDFIYNRNHERNILKLAKLNNEQEETDILNTFNYATTFGFYNKMLHQLWDEYFSKYGNPENPCDRYKPSFRSNYDQTNPGTSKERSPKTLHDKRTESINAYINILKKKRTINDDSDSRQFLKRINAKCLFN